MPAGPLDRRRLLSAGAATVAALLLAPACSESTGNALRLRVEEVSYGPAPMQRGDLHVPLIGTGHPVVVLLHGGYWSVGLDRTVMRPLAEELVQLGYAVWNVDYRRVGDTGGGWPGTLEDVAAAMDVLADLAAANALDLSRVVAIGHSAGSQLAFWSGARDRMPPGLPGADPRVLPGALASLSGVLDLEGAAALPPLGRLADLQRAVVAFVGGTPAEVPERYAAASPVSLLPFGLPQLLLHGTEDEIVPVSLTAAYQQAAEAAGDRVTASLVPSVDHFDTASADKAWWSAVLTWLPTVIGTP